jgi:hydrogenase nickel incorporation protein HypA/HybF
MHELALAQGILEIVAGEARTQGFSRVMKIRLAIGALAMVEPDALVFGFDAVSRGTEAEGAVLDIARPPGRGYCAGCGEQVELGQRGDPCPGCGGYQLMVIGGDELRVTELEVE